MTCYASFAPMRICVSSSFFGGPFYPTQRTTSSWNWPWKAGPISWLRSTPGISWVPLYESSVETVQSELATFFEAFPDGTVWGNLNTDGMGYDVVLVGQEGPLHIDVDEMQR